jgi:4-carboxymuconolactone decarboxylase
MADNPRRDAGREMRRKLMGDAYADKLDGSLYRDPVMEKFAEVTQEAIFGTLKPYSARYGHGLASI